MWVAAGALVPQQIEDKVVAIVLVITDPVTEAVKDGGLLIVGFEGANRALSFFYGQHGAALGGAVDERLDEWLERCKIIESFGSGSEHGTIVIGGE